MQLHQVTWTLVAAGAVAIGWPTCGFGGSAASAKKGNATVKKQARDTPVRERIEWCQLRWNQAPDTSKPRVLLIGDSISVGYSGEVVKQLRRVANVDLMATSAAIDQPALAKMTRVALDSYDHAIIHFNNGLHGWHVSDADYAKHLEAYVQTLKRLAPQAKLIWASSTSLVVSGNPAKLSPKNATVVRRNRIAAEIMHANGIEIDDLYALVVGKADWRGGDPYHYNNRGKTVQGQAVAKVLRKALEQRLDQ